MTTRVQLLGTPAVMGGPVLSRKALAILAILAIDQRAHAREALAVRVWPEGEESERRSAMRNVLDELRDVLGDALEADGHAVTLRRVETVELDLLLVNEALAGRGDLERAASLPLGTLLDGTTFDGGELDDWLARQRDIWRQHVTDLLQRVVEERTARGDVEGAAAALARMRGDVASD